MNIRKYSSSRDPPSQPARDERLDVNVLDAEALEVPRRLITVHAPVEPTEELAEGNEPAQDARVGAVGERPPTPPRLCPATAEAR